MRIARSVEGRDKASEKAVNDEQQSDEQPSANDSDADFENADLPLTAKVEFENVLDHELIEKKPGFPSGPWCSDHAHIRAGA